MIFPLRKDPELRRGEILGKGAFLGCTEYGEGRWPKARDQRSVDVWLGSIGVAWLHSALMSAHILCGLGENDLPEAYLPLWLLNGYKVLISEV